MKPVPAVAPASVSLPEWPFPVRLRHLVALGLLGVATSWMIPRARAAWDIHSLGAELADYALCMAGPTGPELIRDDPVRFRSLIRRRLVASAPDEAPFARCAKAAGEISQRPETEQAHRATARSFDEYAAQPAGTARLTLASAAVDSSVLIERSRLAWPFIRGSTAPLIRPSLGAREAVHPVGPSRPVLGRGLPVMRGLPKNSWRSADAFYVAFGNSASQAVFATTDFGTSFRPLRFAPGVEERAGRCVGKDPKRGFSLASASDGSLVVTSLASDRMPQTEAAVRGEHRLLAVACDDEALVVAARADGAAATSLVICPFARSCGALNVPALIPFSPLVSDRFDLARLGSVTVLAVETRGVVRVVSSRDDGASWTPATVAFDKAEYPDLLPDAEPPFQLLTLGSRLLLYGASSRFGQSYALLGSDDQGASFRPLAVPSRPAVEPARLASDLAPNER